MDVMVSVRLSVSLFNTIYDMQERGQVSVLFSPKRPRTDTGRSVMEMHFELYMYCTMVTLILLPLSTISYLPFEWCCTMLTLTSLPLS
jgi:hypothetical protein